MTIQELCKAIELQECMEKGVLEFYSTYDFSQVEDMIQGLSRGTTAAATYEKLSTYFTEDEGKMKELTVFLLAALRSYETYQAKGISDKIFVDTMKCFTRYTQECKVKDGYYEFDRGFWAYRQASMLLFRLGQLEFEMRFGDQGERIMGVHIPSDAKLTPECVQESIDMALEFFPKHYPDYADVEYSCYSWLMAPGLREILDESSNIVQFQNHFHVHTEDREPMSVLEWVFKVPENTEIAALPENTSLQRKLKAMLLKGENVGIGIGTLIKPEK